MSTTNFCKKNISGRTITRQFDRKVDNAKIYKHFITSIAKNTTFKPLIRNIIGGFGVLGKEKLLNNKTVNRARL